MNYDQYRDNPYFHNEDMSPLTTFKYRKILEETLAYMKPKNYEYKSSHDKHLLRVKTSLKHNKAYTKAMNWKIK